MLLTYCIFFRKRKEKIEWLVWHQLKFLFYCLQSNCTKVQKSVDLELEPYSINVTSAAEVHSRHLCQDNGQCVQRTWRASTYLHLNPMSFQIDALKDQGFIVKVEESNEDLEIMTETFVCHCYQGYEWTDCGEVKVADDHPGSSADSVPPRRFAVIGLLPLPLTGLF